MKCPKPKLTKRKIEKHQKKIANKMHFLYTFSNQSNSIKSHMKSRAKNASQN